MRTEDYFPELSGKIEKSIIAALSSSEEKHMLYKEFKGHKSTAIKSALLFLEKEGYIRFVPIKQTRPTRTNNNFLQYLVGVELLNPKVSNQEAKEFISRFNKTTDAKTKLHLLYELKINLSKERYSSDYISEAWPANTSYFAKRLSEILKKYRKSDEKIPEDLASLTEFLVETIRLYDEDIRYIPTRSKELVNFIAKTLIESEDHDITRECVVILYFLFNSDEKLGMAFVINCISKEIKAGLIAKLIEVIKKDPDTYISFSCRLLTYFDPKATVKVMLGLFKSNDDQNLILNGNAYPDLIKEAYDKLNGDKEWVIDDCNKLIGSLDDEKKKEELRLIIRKL